MKLIEMLDFIAEDRLNFGGVLKINFATRLCVIVRQQ